MSDAAGFAASEAVTDAILGGRLVLRQPGRGHRAGTDAVLLAAAAEVRAGDVMVDVGAGVGTVGLALALRAGDLSGTLLEGDAEAAELAIENCRLNGVEQRLRVAQCDLFDPASRRAAGLEDGKATLVVTNPPFYTGRDTRPSSHPGKAGAHHLRHHGVSLDHDDWLRAAASLLAPRGRFHTVHRPEALPALLRGCEGRLGGVSVMPVHARAGDAAIRVLLSGRKGSRAPLRLCPPLVLHGCDGRFTPEAEALHRGEALIPM